MLYTYKVDAWGAAAYANPGTTTLAFCAASAEYQNGIKLGFVLNSQFEWGIVLIDPAWNLTYNASYPIEMAVDTRASGAAMALATGTGEVLISFKPNVALFKDFMEGERLGIKTAGGTYTFNLTNTAEMLPSLVKCAERYVGPIPASANPSSKTRRRPVLKTCFRNTQTRSRSRLNIGSLFSPANEGGGTTALVLLASDGSRPNRQRLAKQARICFQGSLRIARAGFNYKF